MRVEARTRLAPAATGLLLLLAALASGCRTTDYTALENYYRREPKTIVVLPIRNESTDAEAPRFFLSTIAKPLVYRGYYVMPIESTMEVLAREGLYDAGLAWDVEPELLERHLGADAALYVTINSWDTSYVVLASSVTVSMHYKLVDCHSGETLWERDQTYTKKSQGVGSGGGGLGGLIAGLIVATANAAINAALTDYVPLASEANAMALRHLPPGAYHASHEELQKKIADWRTKQDQKAAESKP